VSDHFSTVKGYAQKSEIVRKTALEGMTKGFMKARRRPHAGMRVRESGSVSRWRDPSRRRALKAEFQATVRSATSTLPFVSGLNSTATRKMVKPTTVVTLLL
jgi:hypothetical protein